MGDVLEKVKRLRALATSSNANEAASAAAIANKLILQFQISETQLALHTQAQEQRAEAESNPEQMFDDADAFYVSARVTQWKLELAQLLAKHYGCAIWNDKAYHISEAGTNRGVSRYRLIGRKDDIQVVKFMFSWFMTEIVKLCDNECRGNGLNYRDSYCKGAVKGIEKLLEYTRAAAMHEAALAGKSQAIELIQNRHKLATAYMHRKYRLLNPHVRRGIDPNAFERGYEVGSYIGRHAAPTSE